MRVSQPRGLGYLFLCLVGWDERWLGIVILVIRMKSGQVDVVTFLIEVVKISI